MISGASGRTVLVAVAFVAALSSAGVRHARVAAASAPPLGNRLVWFTPGPGTHDMRALFEPGSLWGRAWSQVSVLKFYQGQVMEPTPSYYLPNDYYGLASVDAFHRWEAVWHKQTAIEIGVVKAQYCSPDGTAEQNAIRDTLSSIYLVEAAGGHVDYLAFDEPFYAGATEKACGAPDLGPATDRVVRYMTEVKRADPGIIFGLIEPYPYFSATRLAQILDTMRSRGFVFRFLHLDAGLDVMKPAALAGVPAGWQYLAAYCHGLGTRFGVIVNGDNGESADLYANGVTLRLGMLKQSFGAWADMPDDVIFQSWAVNSAGQKIIPPNLPETKPNTGTELIDRGLRLLGDPAAQ